VVAVIIIALLLLLTATNLPITTPNMTLAPNGILSFLKNLLGGYLTPTTVTRPSHLIVFFSNHDQYILGLGNRTIINSSNTTIALPSGSYRFQVGSTNSINNIAKTDLYLYTLTIYNTTALMAVKENNSIQWLNSGNGTFSVTLVRQILNQS